MINISPIRLIDSDGSQVGIIGLSEARQMARERELDLVEISATARPPVCKIMDFGKYRYELSKKDKGVKKQASGQIKGIRLTPKINSHDFEFKADSARKFLMQGNKVKVSVIFRGRLITHKEFGEAVIKNFAEALADYAKVESSPKMEGGRSIVMILAKK
jgi:translation initiation factor IF-3